MRTITIAHSPDADDAFMFWGLKEGGVGVPGLRFDHVLKDIESLNREARERRYDVTAVSFHGYAHVQADYALLATGASIGDRYGPRVVSARPLDRAALAGRKVAHPGDLTTATLVLRLWQPSCVPVAMDFQEVGPAVREGRVDAGVIIHEGQLTWREEGFHLVEDFGAWWHAGTGLPLPLGANAIRRDLGPELSRTVARALRDSILAGLAHRQEALTHALAYGRGLAREKADEFVSMYVNDHTVRLPEAVRRSAQLLLDRGADAGILPSRVRLDYVESD